MGSISIVIDEKLLKELVIDYLERKLGSVPVKENDVKIQVKSKQNYKLEWESAKFRATFNKTI
ncbi:hypothetical protein KAR91_62650 [Candidatus Pacearchaeota archaeon]|nr:hypothetical protein [Candidatus Pacearchaeota archaeon]